MDAVHTSLPQRLLEILEGLLRVPAADLPTTLTHVCDIVAAATGADKIDAFLYDPSRDSLVAAGTSTQPLSIQQRKLGLDVLPLSNGGRAVQVYLTGRSWRDGRVESDAVELLGIREGLDVRSSLGVPLEVGGERRGVLLATSLKPEFFSEEDGRIAESLARWAGLVAHRAELSEAIRRTAVEQGRRAGAEELVTVLAHDLRNQLAPMRAHLDVIGLQGATPAASLEALGRAIRRLEALVSDILDVARIDRGMFAFEPVPLDLFALAREIVSTVSTPQNPVHLAGAQEPVLIAGDPARLRQCVENLVANALQKSPLHAAVTITVMKEIQANGAASALLHVADEGPGIPQELLPHIFERFGTSRGREGGLGLGLYLAKRIAAAHGGDLTVQSEPGRGARFTLTLPAARPAQGSGAAPRAAP